MDNAAYSSAYFVNAFNTVGINLIKYSFVWEIKHQKRAYPGIIFIIYCAVFLVAITNEMQLSKGIYYSTVH